MALLVVVVPGILVPCTMCFRGQLCDQHIKIVLDSGSSHTFISPFVAAQYGLVEQLSSPLKVQVANGQVILCNSYIPAAS
jgi:hypothetical protein